MNKGYVWGEGEEGRCGWATRLVRGHCAGRAGKASGCRMVDESEIDARAGNVKWIGREGRKEVMGGWSNGGEDHDAYAFQIPQG